MTAHDVLRRTDVPAWARRAAHTVPLLTLPSGLWRIALVLGLPLTNADPGPFWERVYIVMLSLVAEGAALLTLGLVQRWGEVAPRWIPWIGGRRVPPMAAFVPAMGGAAVLTALWTGIFWRVPGGDFYRYFDGFQAVVVTACYLPLLAWGPLLAVVAVSYLRRRTTP
ncbi:hypothetical protein [Aeromicrobium sp. CTD01-1L150]|uniref:hypothetical protein n=1 Tax=Aeromicrobium sp. CTD01-1L150 TaxID=3341830 RepID=UPI0035C16E3A